MLRARVLQIHRLEKEEEVGKGKKLNNPGSLIPTSKGKIGGVSFRGGKFHTSFQGITRQLKESIDKKILKRRGSGRVSP